MVMWTLTYLFRMNGEREYRCVWLVFAPVMKRTMIALGVGDTVPRTAYRQGRRPQYVRLLENVRLEA